jgi:hypothetical protein
MGISRDLTARDLAGQPDSHGAGDRLHYGAGQLALRIFGSDTRENRAIIFRWQNELDPALRPSFLIKVGRHIAAWESAIRAHAAQSQQP